MKTEGTTKQVPRPALLFTTSSARPTFPPPIRTTTMGYDDRDNYVESQRSSVTVDSVGSRLESAGRLVSTTLRYPTARSVSPSSTAYPFHPDRLDPQRPSNSNGDKVKWYYNDYSNGGGDE